MAARQTTVVAAALALAACSYSYRNPAEGLQPGEVGGRLLTAGAPQGGVAVSARGSPVAAASRATGSFGLLPLPAGRHTVMFRHGLDRVLQREVEIGFGKDGQPEGVWMGDLELPGAVSVAGTCSAPPGHTLVDGGLVVDEASGASARVDAAGNFLLEGLSIGEHRLWIHTHDSGGGALLGGPAAVSFLATDAGTRKTLTDLPLHAVTATTGSVLFRFALVGTSAAVALPGLTVNGLGQAVAFQSTGLAQADLPEGRYTLTIGLPAAATDVTPPPPVTFVAVAGELVDLGTLYAATSAALAQASLSCHTSADCDGGTCQSGACTGYTPPTAALASTPACDGALLDCTAGGIGAVSPPAMACVAAPSGRLVGVTCGTCCTPDGIETACANGGTAPCTGF